MTIRPVVMRWTEAEVTDADGVVSTRKVMLPEPKYRGMADRQYVIDAEYTLVPAETRNRRFHSAYFAQLNEAFDNLPETVAGRWRHSEHFRKWVLIEKDFFHEKEWTFEGDRAEAQANSLSAFVQTEDEYARLFIIDLTEDAGVPKFKVIVRKAKSQDHASMRNDEFRASVDAVLGYCAELLDVGIGDLRRNAGRNA